MAVASAEKMVLLPGMLVIKGLVGRYKERNIEKPVQSIDAYQRQKLLQRYDRLFSGKCQQSLSMTWYSDMCSA